MERWLPPDIAEEFGDRYSHMLDSGLLLPLDSEAELLAALRSAGIRCREDTDLCELFGDPLE